MNRIISALLLALAAGLAQAAGTPPLHIAENAPHQHVVVRGDTLWGISGRFLKEPWRWPEIWRMNREQIRNPHLIYPGDVIVLDRDADGNPLLRIATAIQSPESTAEAAPEPLPESRLQPRIYDEALADSVPSIPPKAIEPFLAEPLIVEEAHIAGSARIVAMQEDRVFLGAGDTVFVAGASPAQEHWQIYRPAKPLLDPETREVLGYEAFHLGSARQVEPGEPGVFTITTAKQEIGRGDRLLPARQPPLVNYAPHRPETEIEARVASVHGGVGTAGRNSVIAINRGLRDGLEIGHVLALYRKRADTFRNAQTDRMETIELPRQRYGLVFIFRTFERVSYALVLDATGAVSINDALHRP